MVNKVSLYDGPTAYETQQTDMYNRKCHRTAFKRCLVLITAELAAIFTGDYVLDRLRPHSSKRRLKVTELLGFITQERHCSQ
jgi:hypothetical protein